MIVLALEPVRTMVQRFAEQTSTPAEPTVEGGLHGELALLLLVVIGVTLVAVRLYRNGQEELSPAETAAQPTRSRAPTRVAGARPAQAGGVARTSTARARAAAGEAPRRATPPVASGAPCPSCNAPTVPGARFCGECGHRLSG